MYNTKDGIPIDAILMNIAIFRIIDDDFIIIDFNKMAETTEKISKETLIGRNATDVFPGLKQMGLLDVFTRVYESGKSEVIDAAYYQDERISGWRKNSVSKLDQHTIMAVYEDVSIEENQKLDDIEELKKHKIYLDKAQEIAHIGVWEVDMINDTLYWSDEIYAMLGLNKDTFQPTMRNFLDPIHPDDRDRLGAEFANSIKERRDYAVSHRFLLPDGSIRFVEELGEHSYDHNGEAIKSFGVVIDVTERKKSEDEINYLNKNLQEEVRKQLAKIREKDIMLVEESKFSTIGKSVGNVAHQWKRPLSQLNTHLLYLHALYYVGDEKKLFNVFDDNMEKISHIMDYLKGSIEDLHHFFSDSDAQSEFNLFKQIKVAMTLQDDKLILNNVAVTIECDEEILFTGDKHAFANILMILFDNSIDQFEKNRIKDACIDIRVVKRNDTIEIRFKDNAGGITIEPLETIFNMHVSTKGSEGSGLGLPLARKLAGKGLFSDLDVKNMDQGAEFLIVNRG